MSNLQVSKGGLIGMIVAVVVLALAVIGLGIAYGLKTSKRYNKCPDTNQVQQTQQLPQNQNALAGGIGPMQLPGPLAGLSVPGVPSATQPARPTMPAQPAQPAQPTRDYTATADQVMSLVKDPSRTTVVIVASSGCGACHRLRGKLSQLPQDAPVVVVSDPEYAKIAQTLPADKVPQLFKVGKGKVARGPTGDMPVDQLLSYIRAPA